MHPELEFLSEHNFERTDWSESVAAPQIGEPTAGYRIMYTYTDPDTGDKILFSPLVINRPEISQMEMTAERPYVKTGPDVEMPQFGAQRLEGVHHSEDTSGGMGRIGYYYFSNQDTAEDYMAAIMMGTKRVGAKGVGKEAPYEVYSPERVSKNISLDMYRVTGTASANPWDEGYMMNDMVYDPEPVKSFNLQHFGQVSSAFRGVELTPEETGEINERLKRALQYMIKG